LLLCADVIKTSPSAGLRTMAGSLIAYAQRSGFWRPVARRRTQQKEHPLATPNYSYEKRQRELAKKRKLEEKKQRKVNPRPDGSPHESGDAPTQASQEAPPSA
jgi:hypothetical protein